jgi:hypothetical protein
MLGCKTSQHIQISEISPSPSWGKVIERSLIQGMGVSAPEERGVGMISSSGGNSPPQYMR